jgi:hypothetical protein
MNAAELARALGGKKVGDGWLAKCPAHNDHGPSLSIDEGADGKPLVHCHGGCPQDAVIAALKASGLWWTKDPNPAVYRPPRRGGKGGNGKAPASPTSEAPKDPWEAVTPVPPDAPEPDFTHPELGKPSKVYSYTDASGAVPFYVCRWDLPSGKTIRPYSLWRNRETGGLMWRCASLPEPRPLYGLHALAQRPEAPVIVCEGEKAADAAARLFPDYVAVTSPNGAGSADKADWTPLVGRDVVLSPDNDTAGRKYAETVARILRGLGVRSLRLLPPERLGFATVKDGVPGARDLSKGALAQTPEGYDIADAVADGWTPDLVAKAMGADPHFFEDFPEPDAEDVDPTTGAEVKARKGRAPSQADALIALAETAALFHTPDGKAFADVEVDGVRHTWEVESRTFRDWLTSSFYAETGKGPSGEAVRTALDTIRAKARHQGPTCPVHVRLCEHEGRLYLDLGDPLWRAVEVDPKGWRIVDRPPVRFRRPHSMKALPAPEHGGNVNDLRRFLNVRNDGDFVLVVAFLLAALRDSGPYPVLVVTGEQGAAKSTFCKVLRQLVDPCIGPLRAFPREERDLLVAAINSRLVVFDNVSTLSPWLSDALGRLATRNGFSTRELYTNMGEVVFDVTRPVILNGITDFVTRGDLLSRSITITLEPIPDEDRRTECELWRDFEAAHPRILGALLSAFARGLAELPNVKPTRLPRMADFATWALACEPALWPAGTFIEAYVANIEDANEGAIEGDPVAHAVRAFMEGRDLWKGTWARLLEALTNTPDKYVTNLRQFPDTSRKLADRMRRAAPSLRRVGITFEVERSGKNRERTVTLERSPSRGG